MVERREQLGLALEAPKALRVGREGLGQQLQRGLPAEPGVGGAIDLAHPPRAERRRDAVLGQAPADHAGWILAAAPLQSTPTRRPSMSRPRVFMGLAIALLLTGSA